MQLFSWLHKLVAGRTHTKGIAVRRPARHFRPRLEALEDRMLLSTYYAATASDLIADIKAANRSGGQNTIVLTAPTTSPYALTTVDNNQDGPTGLPVISKKDSLTLVGNGDTIERSTASGTPGFRVLDVASGGSLTLQSLTLQNGEAQPAKVTGNSAEGGAIFNQGTLVLSGVTVQSNTATGVLSTTAYDAGGGIWSNGSLTLENACSVAGNSASARGDGGHATNAYGGGIYIAAGAANITGATFLSNQAAGDSNYNFQGTGGSAYGGAIYIAGGTVTMNADSLGSTANRNIAAGGPGTYAPYGNGYGGAVYVASGAVTLTNTYVIGNEVLGDNPGPKGFGGGIYITSGATVYLDSFTVNNTYNNSTYSYSIQQSFPDNIDGPYILQ